jgi:hypothetical protein
MTRCVVSQRVVPDFLVLFQYRISFLITLSQKTGLNSIFQI